MKKYLSLLLVLSALQTFSVSAQSHEKKTIKAGENLADYVYYLFPSFTNGTVKMKHGGASTAKLNFNMLLCHMQFLNEHGDTLDIADPLEIDSVIINDKCFFYKKGYYEILDYSGSSKLAVLREVTYDPVKIGAKGLPSRGGSIDSYTTIRDDNESKQLVLNQDVDVILMSTYYLMNSKDEMFIASKSSFVTVFDKNKETVEGYIKSTKTNYNKEADLKKLFDLCSK